MPSRAKAKAQRSRSHIEHKFSLTNLLSDPFAISSISICVLSWIIAIVGCITTASSSDSFPRFTWWGIVYQLLLLCMLFVFYCFNVVDYYKSFLTGAISVAFVYNTNSATILVYGDGSRNAAASAGVILLSIVNLIWIFYFGSDNGSPTNRWIDSFSLRGIRPSAYEDALIRARRRSSGKGMQNAATSRNQRYTSENFYTENQPQNYVSSTALTGFENTDPTYASNIHLERNVNEGVENNNGNTFITDTSNGNTDTTMSGTLELYSDAGDESFPYTAKTLYSYEADADDAYEISFEQGEILKVSDIEGRWWKAKRSNGDTGIIPSNYVQLIDNNVL